MHYARTKFQDFRQLLSSLTNTKKQRSPWEVDIHSGCQEIPLLLYRESQKIRCIRDWPYYWMRAQRQARNLPVWSWSFILSCATSVVKKAAPLKAQTKEEQRLGLRRLMTSEVRNIIAANQHSRLTVSVIVKRVYEGNDMFKSCRASTRTGPDWDMWAPRAGY
jgi:hypothetical protein